MSQGSGDFIIIIIIIIPALMTLPSTTLNSVLRGPIKAKKKKPTPTPTDLLNKRTYRKRQLINCKQRQ